MNGNSEHHNHSNENNVSLEETDKENGFESVTSVGGTSSGTGSNRNSKEWEKNKAPWMEELKMSQAAKKSQGIKNPPTPSPPKPDPGVCLYTRARKKILRVKFWVSKGTNVNKCNDIEMTF